MTSWLTQDVPSKASLARRLMRAPALSQVLVFVAFAGLASARFGQDAYFEDPDLILLTLLPLALCAAPRIRSLQSARSLLICATPLLLLSIYVALATFYLFDALVWIGIHWLNNHVVISNELAAAHLVATGCCFLTQSILAIPAGLLVDSINTPMDATNP